MIKNFENYLNENNNLSRIDIKRRLIQNKPITLYRGVSPSGKNFYKGDKELPYTYYSIMKDKAESYGILHTYIFNEDSRPIKIFRSVDVFDKFGIHSDIESKGVIETLIKEGYSAIIHKGIELIVLDKTLVKEI